MNDIVIKSILKINPNAQVTVTNDDINSIVWENGTTPLILTNNVFAELGVKLLPPFCNVYDELPSKVMLSNTSTLLILSVSLPI